jgi:hypothetical protein
MLTIVTAGILSDFWKRIPSNVKLAVTQKETFEELSKIVE